MLIPLQGHLVLEYEKNRPSGLGGVREQTEGQREGEREREDLTEL